MPEADARLNCGEEEGKQGVFLKPHFGEANAYRREGPPSRSMKFQSSTNQGLLFTLERADSHRLLPVWRMPEAVALTLHALIPLHDRPELLVAAAFTRQPGKQHWPAHSEDHERRRKPR